MERFRIGSSAVFVVMLLAVVFSTQADNDNFPTDFAAADVNIGERLFLETRFSQYFFTNSGGNVNAQIPGDPTVATLKTTTGFVPGPFVGQAMNCRQCHIVDEEGYGPFGNQKLGNRTYADFARRSPIPPRGDGHTQTTRNSMTLVDAVLPRSTPLFLHHDGQFASAHDLIIGTLTGRNYGWKPEEYATAVHHIASVIRGDNAAGYLATEARGARFRVEDTYFASYTNIFAGFTNYQGSLVYDPRVLIDFLILPQYRLDMRTATDEQILETIASLIEAYLRNLALSQDANGVDFNGNGTPIFNGSPFDIFIMKNNLPRLPATNETPAQYSRRLLQLLTQLSAPQFVTDPADGSYSTHKQTFRFGQTELQGLKIFLTDKDSAQQPHSSNIGNCATCHELPAFTDFIFHNTGASQEEYDSLHGSGSFNRLTIPGLTTRQANYDAYLPATRQHPNATGVFESPPTQQDAGLADLGMWNVFANPDFPAPQAGLQKIVPRMAGMSVPQIWSARMNGASFVFNGGNGAPGGAYYVMASGSAPAPAASWTAVATNTFDAQGNFTFNAPVTPGGSQTFYTVAIHVPTPADMLPLTIARFKTPSVRDLDHSGPYMHTGRMDSFERVVLFYQQFSGNARLGLVRNADPQMSEIHLDNSAILPLAAFLRSLNEDYTD